MCMSNIDFVSFEHDKINSISIMTNGYFFAAVIFGSIYQKKNKVINKVQFVFENKVYYF